MSYTIHLGDLKLIDRFQSRSELSLLVLISGPRLQMVRGSEPVYWIRIMWGGRKRHINSLLHIVEL